MKKINIGILGCAKIADRSFIPAIKLLPEYYNLVAIAGRNKEKTNQFAEKFNCTPIYSYDEIIQNNQIDAIYIPLPTGLHNEWVNKALKKGKHVYSEKSLAFNLNDANLMLFNAEVRNLVLMEGYMFQYHKQITTLKNLLKNKIIGEPRSYISRFGFPPLEKNNFRYDNKIGGGALFDAAGYTIRGLQFILGSDFELKTADIHYDDNLKTSIFGNIYLSNSKQIGALLSFGFDNFYQCNIQIWGEKGIITLPRAFTANESFNPEIIIETKDKIDKIVIEKDNHFKNALVCFHNAIFKPELNLILKDQILQQYKIIDKITKI
jgi:NDP-hexose-3-ketoreductase